ncbi:hypothetical protein ACFUPZ_04015 [Microbacterium oxydans]|uniref:hypothetical protein n=1 Tax=Microbacterium oxydans TaxID=82380 RepID=UPI00362D3D74
MPAVVEEAETDINDDDFGWVIITLTVFAPSTIDELSAFEWIGDAKDGGRSYDLGTIRVDEPDADRRLHALDSSVSTLLDLLSDVPREVLFDEASFVWLFMTFGRGAQTLRPALIQKIAAVNATVWIDT